MGFNYTTIAINMLAHYAKIFTLIFNPNTPFKLEHVNHICLTCEEENQLSLAKAFVKMSANWPFVGTYKGLIVPSRTESTRNDNPPQHASYVHEKLDF